MLSGIQRSNDLNMKCKLCDKEAIYTAKGKTWNRPNGLCPGHHRKLYRKKVNKEYIWKTDPGTLVPFEHDDRI